MRNGSLVCAGAHGSYEAWCRSWWELNFCFESYEWAWENLGLVVLELGLGLKVLISKKSGGLLSVRFRWV